MPQLNPTNYTLARLKHVAGIDAAGAVHMARQLGWYNVMDYGSIADGSANDTAAFTAAISAMPSSGGTLYLPAGQHYIDAGTLTSGLKPIALVGEGLLNTQIKKRTAGDLVNFSGNNTANHNGDSAIHNMMLNGNGLSGLLYKGWHTHHHIFSNVYFYNNADTAVDIVEGWDNKWFNCWFDNCSGATGAKPSVRIRNTANNSGAGVLGYAGGASDDQMFFNCFFDGFKDGAVWVEQGDAANTAPPVGFILDKCRFRSSTVRGPIIKISAQTRQSAIRESWLRIYNKDAGVVANSVDPMIDWRGSDSNPISGMRIVNFTDAFQKGIWATTYPGNDMDVLYEGTTPGSGSVVTSTGGGNWSSDLRKVRCIGATTARPVDTAYLSVTSNGDADSTVSANMNEQTLKFTPSVARTVTLVSRPDGDSVSCISPAGRRKRLINVTGSAGTLVVKNLTSGGTTLKTISANGWAEFEFDSTNWHLIGAGTL